MSSEELDITSPEGGLDVGELERRIRERRSEGKRRGRVLRDVRRADRHLSRAVERAARAVEQGVITYRRRQEESADTSDERAVLDSPLNAAEGMAVTISEASRIPVDLARAADNRTVRRVMRVGVRLALLPFSR